MTTLLSDYLRRWEEHYARGEDLSPSQLCPDRPELARELQLAIDRIKRARQGTEDSPPTLSRRPEDWPDTVASPEEAPVRARGTPAPSSPPGYELLGRLGQGGMGVVYRARQLRLGRVVALKMISSASHATREERRRFQREAEAIAQLNHAHIVQVYEVGEHEGMPYLSLELCPRGSLDKELAGTPLRPHKAAELVGHLAEAMHTAHEARVVHRDLKPANVLLAADGTPKITDFGLAKCLDEPGQTHTNAVLGTPSYMAPEQARGSKDIGPAADVYALGAILFECLVGRPPFKAASSWDTIAQVLNDEPVAPRQLNAKVPRDLETICLKCLEKDSSKRYEERAALADDLHRWRKREPIHARPAGAVERAAKWARRKPTLATLLGVLLVGTVGMTALAAYALSAAGRADKERDAAQRAEADAKQAAENEAIARKDAERQAYLSDSLAHASQLYLAVKALMESRDVTQADDFLNRSPATMHDTWEHRFVQGLHRRLTPRVIQAHTGPVLGLSISRDGKRIASVGHDGTLKVWDASTAKTTLTLRAAKGNMMAVAISPDGDRIAAGLADHSVRVWSTQTKKQLFALQGHAGPPASLAFSPDGRSLASSGSRPDKAVKVWDMVSGREKQSLTGHAQVVTSVAFTRDRLASASSDATVRIWDVSTGQAKHTLRGHDGPVSGVALGPDGNLVASAGLRDNSVRLWGLESGGRRHSFKGHTAGVLCVAVSPDGKLVASGSHDRAAKVWEVESGRERFSLQGGHASVTCAAFTPDGRQLVSGGSEGALMVWDINATQEKATLSGHPGLLEEAALSDDGQLAALQSDDQPLTVWNILPQTKTLTLKRKSGSGLAFSPDARRLAVGEGESVSLWATASGKRERTFEKHPGGVTGVYLSPNGQRVASVGRDRLLKVWNADSGKEELLFQAKAQSVLRVIFEPSGSVSVWGLTPDRKIKRWEASNGRETLSLPAQPGVVGPAISPDGKLAATGGGDRLVKLWDVESGQEKAVLKGHTDFVRCLAFSPDGQRLATGGRDKTVRVWDVKSGLEKLTFWKLPGLADRVAFSKDGKRLICATRDGSVRVWDAP